MNQNAETRIRALERRIAHVKDEIDQCVSELLVDDGARFLVAERLPRLGSASIPAIQRLLKSESASEVRALAAIAGVAAGDRGPSAVELLDVVRAGGEWAPLGARHLASHKVPGTVAVVTDALSRTSTDRVDELVMYLHALAECGASLPDTERKRLMESGAWQIESMLREVFPTDT